MKYLTGWIVALLFTLVAAQTYSSPPDHLYTTGDVMEVDRCASAWLIKRFIDENAVFNFYPKDQLITEGVVFDRPEGSLQRTHNAATFEIIVQKYGLKDERLHQIGKIIHDIEVNFWGKKQHQLSGEIQADVQQAIINSETIDIFYQTCFAYFDNVLSKFSIKTTTVN